MSSTAFDAEILEDNTPASPTKAPAPKLGQLWQMPLLIVSLALFTLAAYLFIDPQPAAGFDEQLARVRRDLGDARYTAAIGRLDDLLKLPAADEKLAEANLLLAEALDRQIARDRRTENPETHRRIVESTQSAYSGGVMPTALSTDRQARSHAALGEVDEATREWHHAVDLIEMTGDPASGTPMRRSAIDLLIDHDRTGSAATELREYLDIPGLAADERAWALGELARLEIDAGRFDAGRSLLAEAMSSGADPSIQGQISYRLGYLAWKQGNPQQAERYLLLARQQLGSGHHLDADAAYVLGRLKQDAITDDLSQAGEFARQAIAYYDVVLDDHPGSRVAPEARLGRSVCFLVLGKDELGTADVGEVADAFRRKPGMKPLQPELLGALRRGTRILSKRGEFEHAINLLAHEQAVVKSTGDDVNADFFARLGMYFERYADELHEQIRAGEYLNEADRLAAEQRVRGLWVKAGDAYVAYSRKLTLLDDEGYGNALWKGVSLYEKAADLDETVAALELFVAERPTDPLAPESMYRLGRAYQALGRQKPAVDAYVKLRGTYPQSLAAAQAAVPLAETYIAQGKADWPKAENVLRSVVEDNPLLSPESQTFRSATWELAQLFYRSERYPEALAKLEEFNRRYPEDKSARLTFLQADCYRQAAMAGKEALEEEFALDATLASAEMRNATSDDPGAAAKLREVERNLSEASRLFDQALARYETTSPDDELDRTYQRLAYFYRADCAFDLGNFEEAVSLYDQAAFRYQDDPSAL
ncbi:MAG: tetratricopeptide repeat protein, partial [Planctomycetota bacterium]